MLNCGFLLLPPRQSPEVELLSVSLPFCEESRLTRTTPSIRRSSDMSVATIGCEVVQPVIFRAGPAIVERTPLAAPPDPSAAVDAEIVVSQTFLGSTRDSSPSACAQSKRLVARFLTVETRVWRSAEKSA